MSVWVEGTRGYNIYVAEDLDFLFTFMQFFVFVRKTLILKKAKHSDRVLRFDCLCQH